MAVETGPVRMVGAAPGDPGLVADIRAIAEADVILHDALATAAPLRLLRASRAEGKRVVRLKGLPMRASTIWSFVRSSPVSGGHVSGFQRDALACETARRMVDTRRPGLPVW